jgi:hypothetical protein
LFATGACALLVYNAMCESPFVSPLVTVPVVLASIGLATVDWMLTRTSDRPLREARLES